MTTNKINPEPEYPELIIFPDQYRRQEILDSYQNEEREGKILLVVADDWTSESREWALNILNKQVEIAKEIKASNPEKHTVIYYCAEGKNVDLATRHSEITTARWVPEFDDGDYCVVVEENEDGRWEVLRKWRDWTSNRNRVDILGDFDTEEEANKYLVDWSSIHHDDNATDTFAYYWKGNLYDSFAVDELAQIES